MSTAGAGLAKNPINDADYSPPPATPATPTPGKASADQHVITDAGGLSSTDLGYISIGDASTAYAYSDVGLTDTIPHLYIEASSAGAYQAVVTSDFGYDITLNAKSVAEASQIAAKLATIGGIASAHGSYSIEESGAGASAYGSIHGHAAGVSGDPAFDVDLSCCSTQYFDLPLLFTRNSADPLQFVSHFVASGTVTVLGEAGSGSVYIDPEIVLAQEFQSADVTLTLGDGTIPNVAAALPEPGSWAMMLGGFGLVGGAMRWRKAGLALG